MDKQLEDAIGTIQHQLVLICDELYNDEDQERKDIENAWNLILERASNG